MVFVVVVVVVGWIELKSVFFLDIDTKRLGETNFFGEKIKG
jgi:hypothetical protein